MSISFQGQTKSLMYLLLGLKWPRDNCLEEVWIERGHLRRHFYMNIPEISSYYRMKPGIGRKERWARCWGSFLPVQNSKKIKLAGFDGLKISCEKNQGVIMISSFLPCIIQ